MIRAVVSFCLLAGLLIPASYAQVGANCIAASGPALIRAEGLNERVSDILIACPNVTAPFTATIDVSFNTNVTSRVAAPPSLNTEAWLLVNEPTAPTPGVSAFRGTLVSPSGLRFPGVTVPAGAVLRIVNVRVNASMLRGGSNDEPVQVMASVAIPSRTVDNSLLTVGLSVRGAQASVGAPTAGPSATTRILPVRFQEILPYSFRIRVQPNQQTGSLSDFWFSESGYLNAALPDPNSFAASGTRLRVRVPVPPGVRVYAPTRANGAATVAASGAQSARLFSADHTGFGGIEVAGSTLFGGTFQLMAATNDLAFAIWEIVAADEAALETLAFNLVVEGATDAQMQTIRRNTIVSLAPVRDTAVSDPNLFAPSFAGPPGVIPLENSIPLPAAAGSSYLTVDAPSGTGWNVTSSASWLTVASPAAAIGPGAIPFTYTANTSAAARTAILTVAGANSNVIVTQAGVGCRYTISPGSRQSPPAGDSARIQVTAPTGCDWTAAAQSPWITVTSGATGSGSDSVFFNVAANTTPSSRIGTITVARQTFTVYQAGSGAYLCDTNAGVPPVVRANGLSERIGDVLVTCIGTPPVATADVLVTLNAPVTNRLSTAGADNTDAFLLINEPAAPVLGTTAIRGRFAGPASIRFPNVPLPGGAAAPSTMRIVNIRANTAGLHTPGSLSPGQVVAIVQPRSSRPIPVSATGAFSFGGSQIVAFVEEGAALTKGTSVAGPVASSRVFQLTAREGFAYAFLPREIPGQIATLPGAAYDSESGFRHPNLGVQDGVATNGTRIRLRMPVPQGVRVFVPVTPTGAAPAQLVSADANGSGGGAVQAVARYGGTQYAAGYNEIVPVSGFATATWEVIYNTNTPARNITVEEFAFNIVLENATAPQADVLARDSRATLAPLSIVSHPDTSSPVPRFLDTVAARSLINLKVSRVGQYIGARPLGEKAAARLAVGSNYGFSYTVFNDSSETANQVTVRGNLPPGFTYSGCTRSDGGACTVTQNEIQATVVLGPGASVDIEMVASGAGVQPGTLLENTISAGSTNYETDVNDNQTSSVFSIDNCSGTLSANSSNIPAGGGNGGFSFGACDAWTVSSAVEWITLTTGANGSGPGTVSFTVAPNTSGAARAGVILVAGLSHIVNQATGCSVSLSQNSATVPSTGQLVTFTLTPNAAGCAWAASSNASWAQVYPLGGSTAANVEVNVFPNFSTAARNAVITLGGVPFNISQAASAGTGDERFVRLMYYNFFGRLPDASEVAFQINNALNAGLTRGQLANNFANSLEFNIGGRFVAGLYVGLLNRDPEYGGWLFQRSAMSRGLATPGQLAGNFMQSAEYISKFGNPVRDEFIRLLYRYILLREASPAEVAFQGGAALTPDTPAARIELARRFLDANEFRTGTGPRLTAFLLFATLLQRDGSTAERTFRADQIRAGTAVVNLMTEFIASPEFNALIN